MFHIIVVGATPGKYIGIAFGLEDQMANADLYVCTEDKLISGEITHTQFIPQTNEALPVSFLWEKNFTNKLSKGKASNAHFQGRAAAANQKFIKEMIFAEQIFFAKK